MKRFILALAFCFITSISFADTITYDASVTGASASLTWLKDALNTAYNVINGNINGNNIATGGVTSSDIATNANPLVRENELIGEMVVSGLTIATSASLTSTITAGVAYVENDGDNTLHRVVTNDTQKTFTASRDTWTYISFTGAFFYDEQANGASQPTTPDNHALIAKVVTDGTTISSVTDYTQKTPTNLRIYTDYKQGCTLSRDIGTATTVYIGPGEVELGTTGKVRRNTTNTTLGLTAVGRNGIDAGSVAAGSFYHVFAVPDDDTTTNFDVIASLSSTDAAGVTDERLIGWFYGSAASTVSLDAVGAWRGKGGDTPNIYNAGKTGLSYSMAAGTAIKLHTAKFMSSGRPLMFYYGANGEAGGGAQSSLQLEISVDTGTLVNSRRTGHVNDTNDGGVAGTFYQPTPTGQHTIDLTATGIQSSTATLSSFYLIIEEK